MHHTQRESEASSARLKYCSRRASELAHSRSGPKIARGTLGSSPSRRTNCTPWARLSCEHRNPGATISTISPGSSSGRAERPRCTARPPEPATLTASAAHFQYGAEEKSVDAFEVDNERQSLAVFVEIAFELGRAVVNLPPHGFRIVDSSAAAET